MTTSPQKVTGELDVAGLKRFRWHQIVRLLRHESDHWIFELLDDHWLRLYREPLEQSDAGKERFELWSDLAPSRRLRVWEYDQDPDTGLQYLVLDAVADCTFSEIALAPLSAGPGMPSLAAKQIAEAFADVAQLLEDWHAKGQVHGDLRPSNLFWSEAGCRLGPPLFDLVAANETRGETALYAAPELLDREPDARFDVFSIGLAMYRVLTGGTIFDELPKPGRDSSPTQLLEELREAGKSLELLYPSRVDRALRSVVANATALDPDERYADAGELRHALLDALDQINAPVEFDATDEPFEELDDPEESDAADAPPISGGIQAPSKADLADLIEPKLAAARSLPRWVYGMTGAAFVVGIFIGGAALGPLLGRSTDDASSELAGRDLTSTPELPTLPPVSAAAPTPLEEVAVPEPAKAIPPAVEPPGRDSFGPEAGAKDKREPEGERVEIPKPSREVAPAPVAKKIVPAAPPAALSWVTALPGQRALQLRLGESVTLRARPSESAEVRWFVNAGEAATGNEFSFSAESTGTYEIRALAIHQDGRLAPRLDWTIAVAE